MFSSLVPAMLNVLVGNDGSCVSATICSGERLDDDLPGRERCAGVERRLVVSASRCTITLDNYNNGRLWLAETKLTAGERSLVDGSEARTRDLRVANAALSQLS